MKVDKKYIQEFFIAVRHGNGILTVVESHSEKYWFLCVDNPAHDLDHSTNHKKLILKVAKE